MVIRNIRTKFIGGVLTRYDRKLARNKRILLERQKEDILSLGEAKAQEKYLSKMAELNSLASAQEIDAFEEQLTRKEQEPFGQDLNTFDNNNQNQNIIENIPKNEPEKSSVPNSGPQAEASESPVPPPKSPKEEASPEKPPGGLARVRNVFRRGPDAHNTESAPGGETKTGEAARLARKQLTDRATQAIKRWAAKRWAAVLATSPITWVIIGIGLLIAIVLFIVAISYLGTLSTKKPSTSGGAQLIAIKPLDDAGALQNFLKLSGDKTVTEQVINETTSTMKKNLIETKDLEAVKANPALVKQIDTALGSLSILEGTKSQESAKAFLTDLGKVYDSMEGNIPTWTVDSSNPTRLPVSGTVTLFNSDLHGNSFLRNDAIDNNNVYIRSDDGQEKCDAVDIGVTMGESIFPIFGGKIVDVSSDGDTNSGEKVIITSNDGKYTALYAHVQYSSKKKDDTIVTTEPLGIAKTNNIQIEIFSTDPTTKENSCLVTTHADLIDHALSSRRHQDWGGYLWDRVVKTFNLK